MFEIAAQILFAPKFSPVCCKISEQRRRRRSKSKRRAMAFDIRDSLSLAHFAAALSAASLFSGRLCQQAALSASGPCPAAPCQQRAFVSSA